MGTWGAKIFDNDDARDVRETYRTQIILGSDDIAAEQAVIHEFSVGGVFSLWLPLAISQWEVGRLSSGVKEHALHEIESELKSLEDLWTPKLICKRREVLTAAQEQLLSPMPARKKLRVPSWAWQCPWPVGSVLQFRIQNPKENNPFLGEYVMLQILGISETPPNQIPCQSISVCLYRWHSKIPPSEQMPSIEATPPALCKFLAPNGTLSLSRCFMPDKSMREINEIKCLQETPLVPFDIGAVQTGSPLNATFETAICRTLAASDIGE